MKKSSPPDIYRWSPAKRAFWENSISTDISLVSSEDNITYVFAPLGETYL